MLGDSNNPKPEGLGYGKSQDFGLNLMAMTFIPITEQNSTKITGALHLKDNPQRGEIFVEKSNSVDLEGAEHRNMTILSFSAVLILHWVYRSVPYFTTIRFVG